MTPGRFDKLGAAGLVSATAFVALALVASGGWLLPFDESARALVQRARSPAMDPVMLVFAVAGSGYALLALAAPAYLVLRARGHPLARRAPAIALGALAFEQLAKWLVARPRPDDTSDGFPSGHVLGSTVFVGLLAWLAWTAAPRRGLRWLAGVAASLCVAGVALCRLYFDVHWLSDVLGGFVGGVAFLSCAIRSLPRGERANAESPGESAQLVREGARSLELGRPAASERAWARAGACASPLAASLLHEEGMAAIPSPAGASSAPGPASNPSETPSRPTMVSREYAADMRALRDRLMGMSDRCREQLHLALDAFWTGSNDKAALVENEERVVNGDEIAVDAIVLRILALRHPVATDLRRMIATFRIVTDLERIGDEAVDLANVLPMSLPDDEVERDELRRMGQAVEAVCGKAIRSFFDDDEGAARDALRAGEAIEALYADVLRDVVRLDLRRGDGHAKMSILAVARCLERIAAHATNIARGTLFVVDEGEMPR